MSQWHQNDLQPMMKVYGADEKEVGHVVETFEDSFLIHKGVFFPKDRYLPYSAIQSIEDETIHLTMPGDEVEQLDGEKRPDDEKHLDDPGQLNDERGHGSSDPGDKENSNLA